MKRALALAGITLVAGGCGGSGGRLTVFAASSLTKAFERLEPNARFDFGGSDELAFQIEQGARPDVYASASPKYAQELFAKNMIERSRVFAINRLVFVVPAAARARPALGQLMNPSVKLVLAASGVPAGDYARKVIAGYCRTIHLSPGAHCPRARVVSEEPDVKGVLAKVALDEADAGFVYATDARAARGKVRAAPIPPYLQPRIRYHLAVVRHARHRAEAEEFVRLVLGPHGRAVLRRAGFELP